MASEAAFTTAIARVRAASMDGEALVLSGDGVSLRFQRVGDPPVEAIVDRVWRLVATNGGGVEAEPVGDVATLIYRADGAFEGSTGARTFSGRWVEANARIQATDMAMAGPDPSPDLAAQDGLVSDVVGDNAPSLDGERLLLTGRGGAMLVYEPAPEV